MIERYFETGKQEPTFYKNFFQKAQGEKVIYEVLKEKQIATATPQLLDAIGKTARELESQTEIETRRISRAETIEIERIVKKESIIDPNHAQELKNSMGSTMGQTTPITVAAIFENNELKYHITDGFHRTEALREKAERIKAVVIYGLKMEDVYDLRVLAASSVKSVQFARLSSWMLQSFENSRWSEAGLTLSQAIGLVVQNSSGKILGIASREAEDLKSWVREKMNMWQGAIGTHYHNIRAVELSFPQIVDQVRSGGGGKGRGQGVLNPSRFRAMVEALPKNLEGQWFMTKLILEHDLVTREIELVAEAVSTLLSPKNFDKETLKMLVIDPINIANELLKNKEEEKEEIEKEEKEKKREKISMQKARVKTRKMYQPPSEKKVRVPRPVDYDRNPTPEQLLEENQQLRNALEQIELALSAGTEFDGLFWWQASFLSAEERKIMNLIINEGLNVDRVAKRLDLLTNTVISLIISATRKAVIEFNEKVSDKELRQI